MKAPVDRRDPEPLFYDPDERGGIARDGAKRNVPIERTTGGVLRI